MRWTYNEHCMRIWSNLKVQSSTNYIKLSLYTSLMSQFCSGIWNLGWLRILANSSWIFLVVPKCSKVYLQCSHVLTTIGIQSVYNRYTIGIQSVIQFLQNGTALTACKKQPLLWWWASWDVHRGGPAPRCAKEDRSLQMCTGTSFLTTICSDFVTFCYILLLHSHTFPTIYPLTSLTLPK